MTADLLPPHQTGRADFPHPDFGGCSPSCSLRLLRATSPTSLVRRILTPDHIMHRRIHFFRRPLAHEASVVKAQALKARTASPAPENLDFASERIQTELESRGYSLKP